MGNLKKFKLLLWKNWLFRKRSKLSTTFAIIMSTLLSGILLYAINNIEEDFIKHQKYFTTYKEKKFSLEDYSNNSDISIGTDDPDGANSTDSHDLNSSNETDSYGSNYTRPTNEDYDYDYIENVIYYTPDSNTSRDLLYYLKKFYPAEFIPVEDEKSMTTIDTSFWGNVTAGVSFVGLENLLPTKLHYRLRMNPKGRLTGWHTDILLAPNSVNEPLNYTDNLDANVRELFILFQHLIAVRFIELSSVVENPLKKVQFSTQKFPYPPFHGRSPLVVYLQFTFQLFIILSFIFIFPILIKNVVHEKETGITELMKLMGFSTWLQWSAWYVSTFIMAMIAAIIMTILLSCDWFDIIILFQKTAPELFLLILLLYITSSISFCFCLSTFFSKPAVATSCTVLITILTFFVPYFAFNYATISLTTKMILLLLPNMALTWMLQFITDFEVKAVGLQWDNLATISSFEDNLTPIVILTMFVFDTYFYLALAWYLDHILPSVYGIRIPWYFLFTKNYWCPSARSRNIFNNEMLENREDFEAPPIGLNPLVQITQITKRFGWHKTAVVAVNNVTFNMYEGQITALLGHNGAGKTTTMSMLTGMFPPTSGTAYINGFDIRSQMNSARKSLGLCPQHDMLFGNLTCREHLKFFGSLKIKSKRELNNEIDSLLYKLQLWKKKNTFARELSGGMKRKLNLGIALIGRPKVVMLDEPTSGLDPEARRAIWDVIQERREGCCVVLSTHFMDEADALADRIAIMANGQLVSCGSPVFLKTRHGVGYHLHVVKAKKTNVNRIAELIDKHINGAYIASNNKNEVSFVLPADQTKHFANFFRDFETNTTNVGVIDFGLSVSTVEDIFFKLGEFSPNLSNFQNSGGSSTPASRRALSGEMPNKLVGKKLKLNQITGLLLKRWYYAKRRWSILIFQIFLPALILYLGLRLSQSRTGITIIEPPLIMDIAQYGSTTVFINQDNELIPWYNLSLSPKSKLNFQPNPEKYLRHLAIHNFNAYVHDIVVGARITNTSILQLTAWYNGLYYHSEPLSLNILHNTLLKYYTKNNDSEIIFENAPIPVQTWPDNLALKLFGQLMVGIYFPLAISFLSSSFVLFLIHERATMCKQLQLMTGIGIILFWGVSFLWDFLIHIMCSSVLLLVIVLFDSGEIFTGDGQIGLIFLLLLLYGWSSLPLTYLMSLTSSLPATGFTRIVLVNVVLGIVLSIILFVASYAGGDKSNGLVYIAIFLSRFFPCFTITFALMKIGHIGAMKRTYCSSEDSELNVCANLNYFIWGFPGIYSERLALFSTGILFFAILALYERNKLQRLSNINQFYKQLFSGAAYDSHPGYENLDPDVAQEKARVHKILRDGKKNQEVLLVADLTKTFDRLTAVRGLNFALSGQECFGLIGVNGAGKSTTFQMLTGNLTETNGSTFIYGTCLETNRTKYLKNIGYCPQFNPLIDYLTGREMLIVFAYLRGIRSNAINDMVDDYIQAYDLQDHARKITRVYSGGNKRKLSVALAFIGDPIVVFLDEPTTGVDPVARRKIRDVLSGANRKGMCVVLTSHSMEECEALCNRVGIMVNGQFRCLGGIQYLKNKFSKGYVLFARMKRLDESKDDANKRQKNLQRFIELHFPSAKLTDIHEGLVQYQVSDVKIKWAFMFETMERAKYRFNLEDYTVSQTSLDQVFLSLARE